MSTVASLENVMTIKDLIAECEFFAYSYENYNLIKESSELRLMGYYLKNQRFLIDNTDLIGNAKHCLSDGFFAESAGIEEYKLLEEKFEDKLKIFLEIAKKKIIELLGKFISFLNKLAIHFRDIPGKTKEIVKKLRVAKLTDADKEAIIDVVNKAIVSSGAPISDKQQEGFHNLPNSVLVLHDNSVKNKLAAALVNTKIYTTISAERYKNALSGSQIMKFFGSTMEFLPNGNLDEALKELERFHGINLRNGVEVSSNSDEVESMIASLEKTLKKIRDSANSGVDKGSDRGLDYDLLFANAHSSVANTISLFASVNRFRFLICVGLGQILNKDGKAA